MKDICKRFLTKYHITDNVEALALLDKISKLSVGYFDIFNFVNVYYKTIPGDMEHLQKHIETIKSMIYAFYVNRSPDEQFEIYKIFGDLVILINLQNRNNSIVE